MASALRREHQFIDSHSSAAHVINQMLWQWSVEWSSTELQVALETIPGHLMGAMADAVSAKQEKRIFYLLNTAISLSVLAKNKPKEDGGVTYANTSALQLAVFSASIGQENSALFSLLRQYCTDALLPAKLAGGAGGMGGRGGGALKMKSVPTVVKIFLDNLMLLVEELKAAHLGELVGRFVQEALLLTDAVILNQLLLRRECCSTSNARVRPMRASDPFLPSLLRQGIN